MSSATPKITVTQTTPWFPVRISGELLLAVQSPFDTNSLCIYERKRNNTLGKYVGVWDKVENRFTEFEF